MTAAPQLPAVFQALAPTLDGYGYLAVAGFVFPGDSGAPVPGDERGRRPRHRPLGRGADGRRLRFGQSARRRVRTVSHAILYLAGALVLLVAGDR